MALVKNGVPYDVAFSVDDETRIAMCIVIGELDGNQWDWSSLSWRERK